MFTHIYVYIYLNIYIHIYTYLDICILYKCQTFLLTLLQISKYTRNISYTRTNYMQYLTQLFHCTYTNNIRVSYMEVERQISCTRKRADWEKNRKRDWERETERDCETKHAWESKIISFIDFTPHEIFSFTDFTPHFYKTKSNTHSNNVRVM